MGNYHVGKTFKCAIETALIFKNESEITQEEIIKLFDIVGNEFYNSDAEFGDLFRGESDAYKLLCKAFYPEILKVFPKIPDEKTDCKNFMIWDKMIYECYYARFKGKYKFW